MRLADCADDVAALVDELGVTKVIAAGYSMGGPVAQLLWRRHPDNDGPRYDHTESGLHIRVCKRSDR